MAGTAPDMKRLLLAALLAATLSTLAGCAFMSDEDKDFYGKGWVKPTELDNPYPTHSGAPVGKAPAPTATSGATSSTGDPTHDGDTVWEVPGAPRPE